ncbi:MAG: helix-turn-helix family protein [Lachnospiraceae bacterium]|jgi:transcriptional regulator with XRE-family HTH domain|nr:helix-turn-helix family protein [Lachnospiraceae bacterium]
MELGKQIKVYRERNGLSQEKLAEKIYVSRQSISNWENEKSYPDIHNILQLSVLFHVSLDELVKGDVDMMKNEVARNKLNFWAKGMIAGMVLMPLSIAPAVRFLGLKGLLIPLFFGIIMSISTLQAERLKKKNNIQTYSEILAYMENKESDKEKVKKEKEHINRNNILMVLASAGFALLLAGLGSIVLLF